MKNANLRMRIILIGFAVGCCFLGSACGQSNAEKKSSSKPEVVKVLKKKPKVLKHTPPVFRPQAEITTVSGEIYQVTDFAFYSDHRNFRGGMYYPSSGTNRWSLYLKNGPIWKNIDFDQVQSLAVSRGKNSDWLKMELVQLDGTRLQGLHPQYAYKRTWHKHGGIYLTGKSEVLGRLGNFKCNIKDLQSLERLVLNGKDAARENMLKFKITYIDKKEAIETTVIDPKMKIIWTKSTPTYLDIYKLKTDMPITVNNVEIKIKPKEIESVSVPPTSSSPCTVKMKSGDIVKVKVPPRIFGRLKNGDILFSNLTERGKPIIKEIRVL
jgi:hypothetical protein